MLLRFLGQSGFEVKSGETRILIDPYFSDIVGKLQGRPRLHPVPMTPDEIPCDGVFCTHNHLDHLDPETVTLFPPQQRFYTTADGCRKLQELGLANGIALQERESVRLGDFAVTAVAAVHSCLAMGLIVKAEGITLYFSGDTLYDEKLFEIAAYQPDVTFICINGRLGNMNCEEAIKVAGKIGARVNIPHHYDMFSSNSENPHLFADRIPGGKILEFNREYRVEDWL